MQSTVQTCAQSVQPMQSAWSISILCRPSNDWLLQLKAGQPRFMQAWQALHSSAITRSGGPLIFTGSSTQGRYVSVEGPVTRMIPGTDELLREISERYLRPEEIPAYIEFVTAELGEQVAIYLRPQRWLSADLGPG